VRAFCAGGGGHVASRLAGVYTFTFGQYGEALLPSVSAPSLLARDRFTVPAWIESNSYCLPRCVLPDSCRAVRSVHATWSHGVCAPAPSPARVCMYGQFWFGATGTFPVTRTPAVTSARSCAADDDHEAAGASEVT
jgi:hypothetical protein